MDRDQVAQDELLRRCESEPIHIPGGIQPHGVLLFVDTDDIVRVASDNVELLGVTVEDCLGRPLIDVVGRDVVAGLDGSAIGEPITRPLGSGTLIDLMAQEAAGGRLIEIEQPSDVDIKEQTALARLLRRLQSATTVEDLLVQVVDSVQALTGFDRVMTYRFDEDWNGTVVAEAVAPGHGAFLGLRYPASDIPPQARALYLRNRVRLIPQVDQRPVPLVAEGSAGPVALDLSDSTLRAVSPVHLEYLRNMGVAASASIALVVGGHLWGLIACHHYSGPRRPSQRIRIKLDVLSGTASALLGALLTTAVAEERIALSAKLDDLAAPLLDESLPHPIKALDPDALAALLDADGAAVVTNGSLSLLTGSCPAGASIEDLVRMLGETGSTELVSDALEADLQGGGAWSELLDDTAGAIAVRWGGSGDWLLWFRREFIHSVRWGGDPEHKEVVLEPDGARLGPRSSFEEFVQTVRRTSRPWTAEQLDAAHAVSRRVSEATARRNRRDRSVATLMQHALLLDTVPAVPGADLAVTYRPARGEGLGGDWYDVYFLPDGRAVVALGDVAGHGMEVAATMSQIRHALRAYVLHETSLPSAVDRLNELSCSLLPGDMATLVVALLDPATRTLEIINAGHLPPVVGHGHDDAKLAELTRNPALGILRSRAYDSTTITLEPGASFVLFTDGLIEKRTVALDDQLDAVIDVVGRAGGASSRVICDRLDEHFAPDGSDDVTVLVLRFLDS